MNKKVRFAVIGLAVLGIQSSAWAKDHAPSICGRPVNQAQKDAIRFLIKKTAAECKNLDSSCDLPDFSDKIGDYSFDPAPTLKGESVYMVSASPESDQPVAAMNKMWVRGVVECDSKNRFVVLTMEASHGSSKFGLDSDRKPEDKSDSKTIYPDPNAAAVAAPAKSDSNCPDSSYPHYFASIQSPTGQIAACCNTASITSETMCVVASLYPNNACTQYGPNWYFNGTQCVPTAGSDHVYQTPAAGGYANGAESVPGAQNCAQYGAGFYWNGSQCVP